MLLLHAILNSGKPRPLFTIDPYGNKLYRKSDRTEYMDYDENFYKIAMKEIAEFMLEDNKGLLTHYHWKITSADFFKIYDQIDIWYKKKVLDEKFGLVYLDGDHEENVVAQELIWFLANMDNNGLIIVDDTEHIEKSNIEIIKKFVEKSLIHGKNRRYLILKDLSREASSLEKSKKLEVPEL